MSNENVIIPVVGGDGIEGNIGSCETHKIVIKESRPSLWKFNYKSITTNSCTGEVNEYRYWEYAEGAMMLTIIGCIILVVAVVVLIGTWIESI